MIRTTIYLPVWEIFSFLNNIDINIKDSKIWCNFIDDFPDVAQEFDSSLFDG
jgi:hypothetical protein